MPIKKSAPITLLSFDRKNHAIRKMIELLLRAAEEKMKLAGSDTWRTCLSHIIAEVKSVGSIAYFTDREDSPYKRKLTAIEAIKFKYFEDSINIILDRLVNLRSDAIDFFERGGAAQHVSVAGKRVSWLKWKTALDLQLDTFVSLSVYAREFSQLK